MNAVVTVWIVAAIAGAEQIPVQFQYQRGTVLEYHAKRQVATLTETVAGPIASASTVDQIQSWQVRDVNREGAALMQLVISKFKLEQTDPSGDVLRYDSDDSSVSHPELTKQLGKLVGQPVYRAQMSPRGDVSHVENLTEDASLSRELPFQIVLPDDAIGVGSRWDHRMEMVLDPPLGDGEKAILLRKHTVTAIDAAKVHIDVETVIAGSARSLRQKAAMAPYLPKGKIVFDRRLGLVSEVQLTVDEKIPDFPGPGESFHIRSVYTQSLRPPTAMQAQAPTNPKR